ncbi:hypothetical protein [Edaphobacter modestus]|uniref:Uncharacterized protein n=1 Tax=Edaphobacter modestus TaxID=388466 RepID=A0A4Q7YR08_9BACT|nr:hypothetical protein [Edaphobacter modestus]RZU39259.1 hypothetical protein BDD14_0618 [Edaphobacter modestus]
MLQILLLTEREVSTVVKINQYIAERLGQPVISMDEEIREMARPTPIDNVAQTAINALTSYADPSSSPEEKDIYVADSAGPMILRITGPEGVKQFIKAELSEW